MSETKKVAFSTLGPIKKEKRKVKGVKSVRIVLTLAESNEKSCPEFNYRELVTQNLHERIGKKNLGDVINGPSLHPLDPLATDEDAALKALAKKLENKYGGYTAPIKKKRKRENDFKTLGEGYDESDPFIDNSDAFDEVVPTHLETKHRGFYINSGELDFETVAAEDEEGEEEMMSDEESALGEKEIKKKKRVNQIDSDDDNAGSEGEEEGEQQEEEFQESEDEDGQPKKRKLHENGFIKHKKRKLDEGELLRKRKKMIGKFNAKSFEKKDSDQEGERPANSTENKGPSGEAQPGDPHIAASIEAVVNKAREEAGGGGVVAEKKESEESAAASSSSSSSSDSDSSGSSSSSDSDSEEEGAVEAEVEVEVEGEGDGDEEGENEEANEEEVEEGEVQALNEELRTSDNENNIPLPDNLPSDITQVIIKLKEEGQGHSSKLSSQKFFTDSVNKLLVSIEMKLNKYGGRKKTQIYNHLSQHLPCGTQTIIKRAKNLLSERQESRLREPLKKLKEAVDAQMLPLVEQHAVECQKAAESKGENGVAQNEDEEIEDGDKRKSRLPKKKFTFTDDIRKLLCEAVRVRVTFWQMIKKRSETPEEYIRSFLDSEVRPIWPKGWINVRILLKESYSAHAVITDKTYVKPVTGKKQLVLGGGSVTPSTTPPPPPRPSLSATVLPKLPSSTSILLPKLPSSTPSSPKTTPPSSALSSPKPSSTSLTPVASSTKPPLPTSSTKLPPISSTKPPLPSLSAKPPISSSAKPPPPISSSITSKPPISSAPKPPIPSSAPPKPPIPSSAPPKPPTSSASSSPSSLKKVKDLQFRKKMVAGETAKDGGRKPDERTSSGGGILSIRSVEKINEGAPSNGQERVSEKPNNTSVIVSYESSTAKSKGSNKAKEDLSVSIIDLSSDDDKTVGSKILSSNVSYGAGEFNEDVEKTVLSSTTSVIQRANSTTVEFRKEDNLEEEMNSVMNEILQISKQRSVDDVPDVVVAKDKSERGSVSSSTSKQQQSQSHPQNHQKHPSSKPSVLPGKQHSVSPQQKQQPRPSQDKISSQNPQHHKQPSSQHHKQPSSSQHIHPSSDPAKHSSNHHSPNKPDIQVLPKSSNSLAHAPYQPHTVPAHSSPKQSQPQKQASMQPTKAPQQQSSLQQSSSYHPSKSHYPPTPSLPTQLNPPVDSVHHKKHHYSPPSKPVGTSSWSSGDVSAIPKTSPTGSSNKSQHSSSWGGAGGGHDRSPPKSQRQTEAPTVSSTDPLANLRLMHGLSVSNLIGGGKKSGSSSASTSLYHSPAALATSSVTSYTTTASKKSSNGGSGSTTTNSSTSGHSSIPSSHTKTPTPTTSPTKTHTSSSIVSYAVAPSSSSSTNSSSKQHGAVISYSTSTSASPSTKHSTTTAAKTRLDPYLTSLSQSMYGGLSPEHYKLLQQYTQPGAQLSHQQQQDLWQQIAAGGYGMSSTGGGMSNTEMLKLIAQMGKSSTQQPGSSQHHGQF